MLDAAVDPSLIQPVILTVPGREAGSASAVAHALAGRPGFRPAVVFEDSDDLGAAESTRRAIIQAGESGGHVLFLEDDLLMDEEAPARIVATPFPETVGVISFCDMREIPEYAPAGLYPRSPLGSDGRGWWGNQALLIHRDIVEICRSRDWFSPDIEEALGVRIHKLANGDGGRNCSDIRLALLVATYGGQRSGYAVSVPSLFRHVGQVSICFPGRDLGERQTRNWIGDRRRFGIDAFLDGEGADEEGAESRSAVVHRG